MTDHHHPKICLIGAGAIGISFAALHLLHTSAKITIYDPRPDLEQHINAVLPGYLDSKDETLTLENLLKSNRLELCPTLEQACQNATIVQEQGPENLAFKRSIWPQIESVVPTTTHLWSSTSGIPASKQSQDMKDRTRLLVIHPFNPPHIMPLIEIVPSPETGSTEVEFARAYFETLGSGHRPVVIHKEVPGFVGNRLAFTMFREACSLVSQGVISVEDLDTLVEASVGPRWAVTGPFKSYNMGGSAGGLRAFFDNLSGTMQEIWDSSVPVDFGHQRADEGVQRWETEVVKQTRRAYGSPDVAQYAARDAGLVKVLQVQKEMKEDPKT